MKKNFLFLTAALLLTGAVSCQKTAPSPSVVPESGKPAGQVTVRIGIPDEETKVLANTDNVKDFQINSVQVFVFDHSDYPTDGSDKLETDYYYEPATPVSNTVDVTLNMTSDYKYIYVLVNKARMYRERGSYTLADFEAELVDLAENSPTGLLMAGKGNIEVVGYNNNQTPQIMAVYVRRLCAMVKLSSVKVDFSQTSLAGATFKITGMYLKNAVGRARMALSGDTSEAGSEGIVPFLPLSSAQYANADNWYNKITLSSGCPAVLVDNTCNDACSTDGTATAIGRCLFPFPNATTTDSHSNTWSVRRTRLTVKAHVTKNADGISIDEDTYYTFDLPVLTSNKVYNIQNIHITQMGKSDDNTDAEIWGAVVSPTILVDEWDSDVINLNYEF